MDLDEAKEQKIPGAMIGLGLVLMLVKGVIWGEGVMGAFSGMMIRALFLLALGYMGCAIVAKTMQVDFGERQPAGLKLAGIFLAAAGVWMFIPWVGWLLALFAYLGLYKWYFEMEPLPLVVCTLVTLLTQMVGLYFGRGVAGWLNS